MSQLILYYTAYCHLCDEAEALMHKAGLGESYQKVEIEDDPELLERYSVYIPVLNRTDNQQELFWPFGEQELAAFLETGP
jgi:hypothetical protein